MKRKERKVLMFCINERLWAVHLLRLKETTYISVFLSREQAVEYIIKKEKKQGLYLIRKEPMLDQLN